jgi:hypothetical protein
MKQILRRVPDAVQREAAQVSLRNLRKLDCTAKRCTADPGPPRTGTVPVLQRTTRLRLALRCARDKGTA